MLTLLLLLLATSLQAQEPVRALIGGTLVNPGAASIADAVVLVRGERVIAAGSRAEVAIPGDAERVELTGKWLVPGYIDGHVHFFQSGGLYTRPDAFDLREVVPYEQETANIRANLDDTFRRTLRSGITTVVDFGGPMWNFDVRSRAQASAFAPRVYVAGPLISTRAQPPLSDGPDPSVIAAATPEQARELVRRQAAAKPDFIKIWFLVAPGETAQQHLPMVRAAIDEAHAHGLRVAAHATELETARAAVEAGADVLVHGVDSAPLDADFIAKLKARGIPYIPTLTVTQGYYRIGLRQPGLTADERGRGSPDALSTFDDLARIAPDLVPAYLTQIWSSGMSLPPISEIARQNLKRAAEAGVLIVAGTDAGNIGTLHGASYSRELRAMADAGLTLPQVLASATLGGARLLGREAELGTIAPGKRADLVVLAADPLADIDNFSRIDAVMKDGVLHPVDSILGADLTATTQRDPDAFRMPGPEDRPEAVVQRQLQAYNARDIDAFLATYSDDAELQTLGQNPDVRGLDAMRRQYAALFAANPKLHCTITRRIVQGRYVIDHEHLTGIDGLEAGIDAIAIYEVHRGKIRRVWFIP